MAHTEAERTRREVAKLREHHAREITALKERHVQEVMKLQQEIKRLQTSAINPLPPPLPAVKRRDLWDGVNT